MRNKPDGSPGLMPDDWNGAGTRAETWKVLEEFSNEQRSRFIEFAWGRSRLPRPGTWNKPLGLTRLGTEPNQLPIAHTCFFNIELPPYDNFEKALKFITIAVEFGTGSMMLG